MCTHTINLRTHKRLWKNLEYNFRKIKKTTATGKSFQIKIRSVVKHSTKSIHNMEYITHITFQYKQHIQNKITTCSDYYHYPNDVILQLQNLEIDDSTKIAIQIGILLGLIIILFLSYFPGIVLFNLIIRIYNFFKLFHRCHIIYFVCLFEFGFLF